MAKIVTLAKPVGAPGKKSEGDPVAVFADGEPCGIKADIREWLAAGNIGMEFPDTFYVIDIPGMPKEIAQRALGPWKRPAAPGDTEYDAPDEPDRYVTLGPNRWNFDVRNKLPGLKKSQLRRDRFIVLEPYDDELIAELNNYMVDRSGSDLWIVSAEGDE